MTQNSDKSALAFNWWASNLKSESRSEARALSARMRRATSELEVLSEKAVFELGQHLRLEYSPRKLALIAMTLAHVDETDNKASLAKRLGVGDPPALSKPRFQTIIRTEDPIELAMQLRRALPLAGNRCNVSRLVRDLLNWNDETKARWWFDYFSVQFPTPESDDSPQHQEETA